MRWLHEALFISIIAESGAYETDTIPTKTGKDVRITFFGHSSLMFEYGGKIVYIDPVSREADYSKTPKADLILVTHEHQDHLDPLAIAKIRKPGTVIVCNHASRVKIGEGKEFPNGEKAVFDDISIEAVAAYNTSPGHTQYHPKGRDNGYILTIGGKRVYLAGDTEDIPEMRSLKDIDIAFLPMNQPFTMTCRQVAEAAKSFKPKILYPYHFGDTETAELQRLLKNEPGIEVRIRKLS
jgi:L-ascorbate metabolism protein UlaG (beta-lactamase superfamily)